MAQCENKVQEILKVGQDFDTYQAKLFEMFEGIANKKVKAQQERAKREAQDHWPPFCTIHPSNHNLT